LGKAWFHATESVAGRDRFDTVILDAPATGHGLEMLRVPRVITEAAAPGILKRDAERAWEMITDPSRTSIVVVSLPEELPLFETEELIAELRKLGLEPGQLVLNGRLQGLFGGEDPAWLGLDRAALGSEARQVLAIGERRLLDERAELAVERAAHALGIPTQVLPWLPNVDTPAGSVILARAFNPSG
jgi:anion-transporting  ArsA/GET3 family ATPase